MNHASGIKRLRTRTDVVWREPSEQVDSNDWGGESRNEQNVEEYRERMARVYEEEFEKRKMANDALIAAREEIRQRDIRLRKERRNKVAVWGGSEPATESSPLWCPAPATQNLETQFDEDSQSDDDDSNEFGSEASSSLWYHFKPCTTLDSMLDGESVSQKYPDLRIPPDFIHVRHKWLTSLPMLNPFPFTEVCNFDISQNCGQPEYGVDYPIFPADINSAFSAKVVLIDSPGLSELLTQCWIFPEMQNRTYGGSHPGELLKFLVTQWKDHDGNLGLIGGPWSPSEDGPNPEHDPQVLINTAIRCCRTKSGIELSHCQNWYRFLEISYMIEGTLAEMVVVFLVDVSRFPESHSEYHFPSAKLSSSSASILVQPNYDALGDCDLTLMSLREIQDCTTSYDMIEGFEISLFAKAFDEMLMRDFGLVIYRVLSRSAESGQPQLGHLSKFARLAFTYFDLSHCGFLMDKNLEALFVNLRLPLSNAEVSNILEVVIPFGHRLHYSKIPSRETEVALLVHGVVSGPGLEPPECHPTPRSSTSSAPPSTQGSRASSAQAFHDADERSLTPPDPLASSWSVVQSGQNSEVVDDLIEKYSSNKTFKPFETSPQCLKGLQNGRSEAIQKNQLIVGSAAQALSQGISDISKNADILQEMFDDLLSGVDDNVSAQAKGQISDLLDRVKNIDPFSESLDLLASSFEQYTASRIEAISSGLPDKACTYFEEWVRSDDYVFDPAVEQAVVQLKEDPENQTLLLKFFEAVVKAIDKSNSSSNKEVVAK